MKLYQSPGGTWCGTEKDFNAALKAEGIVPKEYTGRKTVDVPVSKADLMEFLTFHNVNVISPNRSAPAGEFSPSPPSVAPAAPPAPTTMPDLDELFEAAPIVQRLRLSVGAIDAASAKLAAL